MAKKKLTVEQMRAKIMAYDMCAVLDDAEKGDLTTLMSILEGDWGLAGKFTESQLRDEWREGDYGGATKARVMTQSPAYHRHEYIRQLWDTGNSAALWDGDGKFHGPDSKQFKTFGRIAK